MTSPAPGHGASERDGARVRTQAPAESRCQATPPHTAKAHLWRWDKPPRILIPSAEPDQQTHHKPGGLKNVSSSHRLYAAESVVRLGS